jgi:hypothetical protein
VTSGTAARIGIGAGENACAPKEITEAATQPASIAVIFDIDRIPPESIPLRRLK